MYPFQPAVVAGFFELHASPPAKSIAASALHLQLPRIVHRLPMVVDGARPHHHDQTVIRAMLYRIWPRGCFRSASASAGTGGHSEAAAGVMRADRTNTCVVDAGGVVGGEGGCGRGGVCRWVDVRGWMLAWMTARRRLATSQWNRIKSRTGYVMQCAVSCAIFIAANYKDRVGGNATFSLISLPRYTAVFCGLYSSDLQKPPWTKLSSISNADMTQE